MRYFVNLNNKRLISDPLEGLEEGGDTPASRRAVLYTLAKMSGYDSWNEMKETFSLAKHIKLKPVPMDMEKWYATMPGPITRGQIQHIEILARRAGFEKPEEATMLHLRKPDVCGLTQGRACCLIERMSAAANQVMKIECEAALLEAYASMVGEVTMKQLEYLTDLAEQAGYMSLGEAITELADGKSPQELNRGEANFMMDQLKSRKGFGDDLSFMGH